MVKKMNGNELAVAMKKGWSGLVFLWAPWCAPCLAMRPTVEDVASEGWPVAWVNVNGEPTVAAEYGVRTIPCFLAVENGNVVRSHVGVMGKADMRGFLADIDRRPA